MVAPPLPIEAAAAICERNADLYEGYALRELNAVTGANPAAREAHLCRSELFARDALTCRDLARQIRSLEQG